jgi:hypothetical protein
MACSLKFGGFPRENRYVHNCQNPMQLAGAWHKAYVRYLIEAIIDSFRDDYVLK